jgi:hypothetical protein
MSAMRVKRAMATALAVGGIASAIGAPTVSARPMGYFTSGATGASVQSTTVPPPPSSIAAPAGEEYAKLRAPQPVVDAPAPTGGFDLPSAAIGAATGAGLVIVLVAAGGLAKRRPLTRRHGTIGA